MREVVLLARLTDFGDRVMKLKPLQVNIVTLPPHWLFDLYLSLFFVLAELYLLDELVAVAFGKSRPLVLIHIVICSCCVSARWVCDVFLLCTWMVQFISDCLWEPVFNNGALQHDFSLIEALSHSACVSILSLFS